MTLPTLGRDVYLALAAVAWSDGFLDDEDSEAIIRVAEADGQPSEALSQIRSEISRRIPLTSVAADSLGLDDRMFVYAVATWMTHLDGAVSRSEGRALAEVASSLHLSAEQCEQAHRTALEVAESGKRPKDYDLVLLRQRLSQVGE